MPPIVPPQLGDSLILVSPMIWTSFAGIVLMVMAAILRPLGKNLFWFVSTTTLLGALALALTTQGADGVPQDAFSGMLRIDAYGVFFEVIVLTAGLFSLLISESYLDRIGVRVGEYYALVIFGITGMMFMGFANDLMMVFIALEVMSIAMYVLCALKRGDARSVEAGFKYFILGAFSSGLMLYGISLIYGAVGTTNLSVLSTRLAQGVGGDTVLAVGGVLLVVGFAFKVGGVPFHMWVPDVYQGAPTAVSALMASGVKAASFAAFGRVVLGAMGENGAEWSSVLCWMSAATMLVGNIGALVQNDLKRMLAYSSIAHAGYMLMALASGLPGVSADHGNDALAALPFYMLAYTFMNAGAFAVLSLMTADGQDATDISRLAGLGKSNPWLAAGLSICLLSLAGIPPTMGFVGKFYLFAATIGAGNLGLAIVGALAAAIGVYYYLRPMLYMYMREGHPDLRLDRRAAVAVALACAAMVVFGVMPSALLNWASESIRSLAG